jgi:hypothetical protein
MITPKVRGINSLSASVGVFGLIPGAEFLVIEALGVAAAAPQALLLGEIVLVARPVSPFQAFEDQFNDIWLECHQDSPVADGGIVTRNVPIVRNM